MRKPWIWTIHGLHCSKHGSALDLYFVRTINPWIGQTLLDLCLIKPCLINYTIRARITFMAGRPRLRSDLPTHMHCTIKEHPQKSSEAKNTHRNQARILPVSFVVNNRRAGFFVWIYFRKLTCIRKLNPNENFCAILYCMRAYCTI